MAAIRDMERWAEESIIQKDDQAFCLRLSNNRDWATQSNGLHFASHIDLKERDPLLWLDLHGVSEAVDARH